MSINHTNANRLAARARGAVGAACLALFLAVSASNPTLAQAQCGEGQGSGANISTCADEILNEQQTTINLLEEMTQEMGAMGLLQADEMDAATLQLGFIRKSHDRGRKEKEDTTDEEFGSIVEIGQASNCEFFLLPRFRMGPPPSPVCMNDEITANKCEEVCDFSDNEKNRNAKRGLRLEDDLADALEQTKMANEQLENAMDSLATRSVQILSADDDACAFDNPHPNLAPYPPGLILFHNQIDIVTQTIATIGKDACQQDAAGFNGSTACIVLSVLEGAQKALTSFVTTIDGNFTSAKVDATFDCVKDLKAASDDQGDQLGDIETKVDAVEGKVDAVRDEVAEVKALMDEVRSLLSTPQGLRPDFPTK